jgi:hypothetical protein
MIRFPTLPTYSARWRALQFETIPGSGERFTFAIIACGEDGASDIRDALKPGALRAMYGQQGDVLQGLLVRSIITAKEHLTRRGNWLEIPITLSNIFLGDVRETLADDLEQVFDQAIRLSTSLGHSTIGANENEHQDVDAEIKEWAWRVKAFATIMDENLKPCFNRKIKQLDEHKPKSVIGFMTDKYAASFGVLHARSDRISADITSIKRRLWDLSQLSYGGLLFVPKEREIIVGRPAFELIEKNPSMVSNLRRKLAILRDEAGNAKIGVHEATTPMEAANYLVKKVANG